MKIFNQDVFQHWPLEDKSVQALITSPPYFSLRSYSIPDVIIGGDSRDCKHEWGEGIENSMSGGMGESSQKQLTNQGTRFEHKSNFCIHCNAWQGQHGLEPSFKLYLAHCKLWMQEATRCLRDNGVIFINLADSYNSTPIGRQVDPKRLSANGQFSYEHKKEYQKDYPNKSKLLIPERFAIMCVDELGLILRNHIVWYKPNGMPESCQDRFSKKWESIFMFTKQSKYYFNLDAVKEPFANGTIEGIQKMFYKGKSKTDDYKKEGIYQRSAATMNRETGNKILSGELKGKNPGDVWSINTQPSPEKHFAMFPEKLVERMILCSTKAGDTVLDCFAGSCTTGKVAIKLQRKFIGLDLGYEEIAKRRISNVQINLLT